MRHARDGWSIEVGLEKGRPAPDWYRQEPPLGPDDAFYMSAFWALSTCRQIGFSPGPIPWNQIIDYAEFAGLDRDNAFAFSEIIMAVDRAYLDHLAEQSEREAKMKNAPSRAGDGAGKLN